MKILYVTTIASTMHFFENYITELVEAGNKVEIACNSSVSVLSSAYEALGCKIHNIPFSRSPLSLSNIKAYKMLKKVVNSGGYDIVHCHTPIAAAATRLACKKVRKSGTKVFYTAHGFHFYKGAPFKNKLMFYPIEKICAKYTDTLITINKEDFELAQRKFKAKKVCYVPGVGINVAKFRDATVDAAKMREEIGIPDDAKILLSVGELNANKNHIAVIKALADMENKNIHYVVAGEGSVKEMLSQTAAECGVGDRVHLLGKRSDVELLYKLADLYVHPSFREGLPVAVMEAMASGLPCVVSNIRGSRDLVEDGKGGIVVKENNSNAYKNAIEVLLGSDTKEYSEFNKQKALNYEFSEINGLMREIYGIN